MLEVLCSQCNKYWFLSYLSFIVLNSWVLNYQQDIETYNYCESSINIYGTLLLSVCKPNRLYNVNS